MNVKTFLSWRRNGPASLCAIGIDQHANGSIDFVDIDFAFTEIAINQANVLSHPCTQKLQMSYEMYLQIGQKWEEFRHYQHAKNEPATDSQ